MQITNSESCDLVNFGLYKQIKSLLVGEIGWMSMLSTDGVCLHVGQRYIVYSYIHTYIHRGYSNFLLNMAFISPSEVENIYIS